jgi:RNA polymerase sigma-70 factor (ECF subfamily)
MRNEFTREDLCQETFLRAYEKLGTFDLARPFGPWILRIAFHLAVRKHQQPGPGEIPLWEEADNWHPELSYQKDPADRVWVDYLLERLPPGIRLLFLLKYSLELTYEEMAQVFEEPAAAIKTRLHRACLRLRASLEDQDTSPKNQNPTEKGEG